MHTPEGILMRPVAHIRSDFPTKFGIPKQSGLSKTLEARVVFCPEYRSADAVRGFEKTPASCLWPKRRASQGLAARKQKSDSRITC